MQERRRSATRPAAACSGRASSKLPPSRCRAARCEADEAARCRIGRGSPLSWRSTARRLRGPGSGRGGVPARAEPRGRGAPEVLDAWRARLRRVQRVVPTLGADSRAAAVGLDARRRERRRTAASNYSPAGATRSSGCTESRRSSRRPARLRAENAELRAANRRLSPVAAPAPRGRSGRRTRRGPPLVAQRRPAPLAPRTARTRCSSPPSAVAESYVDGALRNARAATSPPLTSPEHAPSRIARLRREPRRRQSRARARRAAAAWTAAARGKYPLRRVDGRSARSSTHRCGAGAASPPVFAGGGASLKARRLMASRPSLDRARSLKEMRRYRRLRRVPAGRLVVLGLRRGNIRDASEFCAARGELRPRARGALRADWRWKRASFGRIRVEPPLVRSPPT